MKVLIVRLSSMGDLIHSLPALTDAARALPHAQFDWAVDSAFAEIPRWHPAVNRVLVTPPRKWKGKKSGEFKKYIRELREESYDLVIDIQAHWKTAMTALLARGPVSGYSADSVNEWGAQFFYREKHSVARHQHSIQRMRQLVASAMRYSLPSTGPDFGIDRSRLPQVSSQIPSPYFVFIHSTSWESKCWPEKRWIELAQTANDHGFQVVLPWGTTKERERAQRIAEGKLRTFVLSEMSISQKASVISSAHATVGLDTGLSHIAAALEIPSVTLYGATDPALCGTVGKNQVHLASKFRCTKCHAADCTFPGEEKPSCLVEFTPETVWNSLLSVLAV